MNTSYLSSSFYEYAPSYDYSYEYSSPPATAYSYPSFLPSCPIHQTYSFHPSSLSPSMNVSPISYTYHQQPQVYSTSIPQQVYQPSNTDRTPLRRHQCFKKNDLQVLHQSYRRDPHPSSDNLQLLATELKVSVDKVRQWFKNRRHSDKQKRRDLPKLQTSSSS